MSIIKGKKKGMRRRTRRPRAKKRIDINAEALEFTNTELLKKFITESGRILPKRITGMPNKLHRKLTGEIKRARNVLLVK